MGHLLKSAAGNYSGKQLAPKPNASLVAKLRCRSSILLACSLQTRPGNGQYHLGNLSKSVSSDDRSTRSPPSPRHPHSTKRSASPQKSDNLLTTKRGATDKQNKTKSNLRVSIRRVSRSFRVCTDLRGPVAWICRCMSSMARQSAAVISMRDSK